MMFFLASSIWFVLLLQMFLYILSKGFSINLHLDVINACKRFFHMIGVPYLEYIVDVLIFYTFGALCWKIASQAFATWRMQWKLKKYRHEQLTSELCQRYYLKSTDLVVISYPLPFAMTMGILSPKIILSTGIIAFLTKAELDAVMYHEISHKHNYDPLNMFLLSLYVVTMPYISILVWFNHQYHIVQELMADESAIKKQGTPVYIGSALLKMIKIQKHESFSFVYASFVATSVNYRMDYILNPLQEIQLKVPKNIVMTSWLIFSLISLLCLYVMA